MRLDKGFIIHLGQLNITEEEGSGNDFEPESLIPRIKKWGHLIQEINIDRIAVKDQVIGIAYRNGSFHVHSNTFTIEATVAYEQDTFLVNLTKLTVKPYNLTLSGKASYSRLKDRFLFTGGFKSPWGTGDIKIAEQNQEVDIQLSTNEFTDLVAVLSQFHLDQDLLTWLSQNISAPSYQVTQLRIQFPLKDLKNIGPDNISGTAIASSAAVRFHPDLAPIKSERINISYQSDRLSFALENPMYENINLAGSHVDINHLIQGDSQLVINIQTETGLNKEIIELLGKYGIDFPARQESGTTKADLNLVFDLPEFSLNTKGTFTVGQGDWTYGDIPLRTKEVTVQLHNNTVTIQDAEVSYEDILYTRLSGFIDFAASHADVQNEIEHLNFKIGDTTILKAAGIQVPLEIDFGKDTIQVKLKEYQASLTLVEGLTEININSLKKITSLVPILQKINFSEGNIYISIPDLDNIDFSGVINIPNTFLSLKDMPITRFQFQGNRTPHKTDVSVNDNKITASLTDKLTVDLQEYLVTVDINTFKDQKSTPAVPIPLEVTGPKVNLKVKEFFIPTREFEFKARGPDISLKAELEQGHFLFESSEKEISFVGTKLDGKIAETFIDFADFSGGTLNVSLKGDMTNYKGYFEFSNVLVKGYLFMNNILAFLNTIPALATLSSPGFDEDGYRIKDGIVYFDLADKLLSIRHLRADGTTVNCEAQGWVNFNDSTLEIDLELHTLKDYSYLISKIPLAGYAILGEDGSLSTSLKIDGPLANPSIETYLAEEIIMTPFNVIKRTFEWPFKMIDKINEQPTEIPEPDHTDPGKDDKTTE